MFTGWPTLSTVYNYSTMVYRLYNLYDLYNLIRVNQSGDMTEMERRLFSVEQRLERAEFQLREFRQDLRQLHQ